MSQEILFQATSDGFSFFKKDPVFIKELSRYLQDKKVLEIFSGNGLLSRILNDNGVDIKATSLFKGYDYSSFFKFFDVEELSCFDAVNKYGDDADVLLMSWPEANNDALIAAMMFFKKDVFKNKRMVYIGERTDLGKGIFGGCASDLFFELFSKPECVFNYTGNYIEVAEVFSKPDYLPM